MPKHEPEALQASGVGTIEIPLAFLSQIKAIVCELEQLAEVGAPGMTTVSVERAKSGRVTAGRANEKARERFTSYFTRGEVVILKNLAAQTHAMLGVRVSVSDVVRALLWFGYAEVQTRRTSSEVLHMAAEFKNADY